MLQKLLKGTYPDVLRPRKKGSKLSLSPFFVSDFALNGCPISVCVGPTPDSIRTDRCRLGGMILLRHE
jgi:hypothetical protein